jgi:hypothetical protein
LEAIRTFHKTEAVDAVRNSYSASLRYINVGTYGKCIHISERNTATARLDHLFSVIFPDFFLSFFISFLTLTFSILFRTNRTESDSLRIYKWRLICLQRIPLYFCEESNEVAGLSEQRLSKSDAARLEWTRSESITVTKTLQRQADLFGTRIMYTAVYLSHTAGVESSRVEWSRLGCWFANRFESSQIELSPSKMLQR